MPAQTTTATASHLPHTKLYSQFTLFASARFSCYAVWCASLQATTCSQPPSWHRPAAGCLTASIFKVSRSSHNNYACAFFIRTAISSRRIRHVAPESEDLTLHAPASQCVQINQIRCWEAARGSDEGLDSGGLAYANGLGPADLR